MTLEYDEEDRWLVATDSDGVPMILARDVAPADAELLIAGYRALDDAAALRDALTVISDGRHPDGHRGAVLVARAALSRPAS